MGRSGPCPFQRVPDHTPCRDLEEETWLHFATRQRWRGGGFRVDKDRAQMEPGLLTHAPTPVPTRSLLSGLPGTQQEPVPQRERGGETYVLAQPPIPALQKLHPRLLTEEEMTSWGQRVGDQAGTECTMAGLLDETDHDHQREASACPSGTAVPGTEVGSQILSLNHSFWYFFLLLSL